MSNEIKTIRIFISSPGDVAEERALTKRVIKRLQGEFSDQVVLDPIFWEHEPLLATKSFQEQIVRPSETDIVITILWSRLGTRLPADFTREDGSRYESGTEFEFEDAVKSFQETGIPDLLIYRKTAEPVVSLKDRQSLMKKLSEKEALDHFFDKWFHDKAEGTLIAAFHSFDTSADFEEILESHLRKLIENRLPESVKKAAAPTVKPQWQEGSPFRGLNVFEFEHAPVFFGRTKAVSEIIDALRQQTASERSFILILGMSGGGKSSLVRAGVLPMLSQPGVIEGVGLWRRATMKPSDSPGDLFDSLASSLLQENALPELTSDRTSIQELAKILRDTPKAAVPLIKGGLSQAASDLAKREELEEQPTARLALVVDQMEEMYSLESITQKERIQFIEALDALARSGRVWVIATLRSDYYPLCSESETLVELKDGAGQYDLLIPTAAEIGQMIRQPALAAGLYFEENSATGERLDDVLRDAAAKNPAALPLLEFTLEELYKWRADDGMLTFEAYQKLGGVEGALAQRAEEVYSSLTPRVQKAMDTELHSLISIGVDEGEKVSRKYAPLDLVTATPETKAFVDAFVDARLFITDLAVNGQAVVSIAHEALLWHWPRLNNWIDKNKESLRAHARVTAAARHWEEENQSGEFLLTAAKPVAEAQELLDNKSIELTETEKSFIEESITKRKRIRWLKRTVVAVLAVLTILAGGAAYLAEEQRNRAETEAQTAEQVSNFLVGLFEVSDPSEALGDTITAREILDKGTEKIEKELSDQPEVQATLMTTMGQVYQGLGLFDQSETLLEKALNVRTELYGEEHQQVCVSMSNLGNLLADKGDFNSAESLLKVAADKYRLYTDDSRDYADIVANLAGVLLEKGDYSAADSLYMKEMAIRRKLSGDFDEDIARIFHNRGGICLECGDFEGAELKFREALKIRLEVLGNEHPLVANTMDMLSQSIAQQGKYKEAETISKNALIIRRKILGSDHPDVGLNLNNLAYLLIKQKKYTEAEPLIRESLSIQRKALGEKHPWLAFPLNNLAFIMTERKMYKEAESAYRECLSIFREAFGKEHPNIATILHNLGTTMCKMKEYEKAEPIIKEALRMRRKLLPEDHPDLAKTLSLLAGVYAEKENYSEAYPLLQESTNIFQKVLPKGHLQIIKNKRELGYCLTKLKRFKEAEQLLLGCCKSLELKKEIDPKETKRTLEYIVNLYSEWNKPEKAAEYKALMADSKFN